MTLSLIDRLREAKGADRELGREVLLACGWRKTCVGHFHGPLYYWSSPDGRTSFNDDKFRDHDPTASVDAALSLVPADSGVTLIRTDSEHCCAEIDVSQCDGATLALALCIAALEARAAMAEREERK